jgi:hypothetical protein
MFTGDDDYAAAHDLTPVARSATRAFMNSYGIHRKEGVGSDDRRVMSTE